MATTSTTTETAASTPVIDGMIALLADSYQLMSQTHLAHWNVEGSDFFHLHTAFQGQYEELFEAIDQIAEHLRALDAYPPSGLATLADLSPIKEMPTRCSAKDFVAGLAIANETLIERLSGLRKVAGEANDVETEDLAIERLRVHEKTLWMLRSYLK